MTYEDPTAYAVDDVARYTITLPQSYVEDEIVMELRAMHYPEETIRMVGLLGHLTLEYGHYYREGLLDALLGSIAASGGLDEGEAEKFRQALEVGIREHHDNPSEIAA